MAPPKTASLSQDLQAVGDKLDIVVAALERLAHTPALMHAWQVPKVPLRRAQLKKIITAHSMYTTKHDVIEHNEPQGLRLTLVDNTYVYVESPKHVKDRSEGDRHTFIVPLAEVAWIEPLVQVAHRLSPEEHLALVKTSVDRTNYLAEVEPPPPPPPEVMAAHARAAKFAKKDTPEPEAPNRTMDGVTIASTQDENERDADDAADEAATLAEMRASERVRSI